MKLNKKKILLLVQLPEPTNGVSVVNQSIMKSELIKKNYHLDFVDISTSKNINEIDGFTFKKILFFFKSYFFSFIKLILFKPDAVYFSVSLFGLGFLKDSFYIILCKFFHCKIICHIHRSGLYKKINHRTIIKFYYKLVFKNIDIIHLSESLRKDIKPFLNNNSKIVIVNNGISKHEIKIKKKKNFISFVFLANLTESKGIKELLDSITHLNKKTKLIKFNFNIIGDFTNTFSREDKKSFLKLNHIYNNVKFFGFQNGKNKFKILANSDIMIYPTKDDCFPLCILEALSYGLPVISTNVGAIPDIIKDKVNGIIIYKNNKKNIISSINYYLKNKNIIKKQSIVNEKLYNDFFNFEIFENNMVKTFKQLIK